MVSGCVEGLAAPEPEPEAGTVTVSGCGDIVATPEVDPVTVMVSGCDIELEAIEPEPEDPGEPGAPDPYGETCGAEDGLDGTPWPPVPDRGMVSVPVNPEKPGPDGTV